MRVSTRPIRVLAIVTALALSGPASLPIGSMTGLGSGEPSVAARSVKPPGRTAFERVRPRLAHWGGAQGLACIDQMEESDEGLIARLVVLPGDLTTPLGPLSLIPAPLETSRGFALLRARGTGASSHPRC